MACTTDASSEKGQRVCDRSNLNFRYFLFLRDKKGAAAMRRYRVTFFKNLLSSDGHLFKCLQQSIEIRRAKTVDRAVQAAERRYERICRVPDWKLHADTHELEVDGVDCYPPAAMPAKSIPHPHRRFD